MFLSNQGLYSITYGQELNLIANAIPVSEPIQDLFRRINWDFAENAVGVYHDNRYFLAIPLDESTKNNAVFVYNFLNEGWESLDLYENLDIRDMFQAPVNGFNRLFFVTDNGAVHITEEREGADRYEVDIQEVVAKPIQSVLTTRRYIMSNLGLKRYSRSTSLLTGQSGSLTSTIEAITKDPDNDKIIETKTLDVKDEDYKLRSRIGLRGYGCQLTYRSNNLKVRGCTVDATVTGRNNLDRE